MEAAFATVLYVVVFLAAVVALVTFAGSSKTYGQIGRGGLSLNEEGEHGRPRPRPRPAAVVTAERDTEIRQMLTARNERRIRRGQAPLDVEAELARLTAAPVAVDPGLRDEVRSLAIARNERRVRQGKEPLDVEQETERQLQGHLRGPSGPGL